MPTKEVCLSSLLCFGVFMGMITYTLIAPLLPSELIRRDINSVYSGIIMGFYSILSIPIGPLIPKICYPSLGYMPVYTIGAFILAAANLGYGFCHYIPLQNKGLFIGMNIAIRLIQGVGIGFVYQTCFTLLALVYKQGIGRVVALISFASSLGVALGPTVAGIFYSLMGYVGPFFAVGGIFLIFALMTLSLKWEYDPSSNQTKSRQFTQVTYASFCKNKLALVMMIAFFMRNIVISFYEPTLAVKLELVYGFTSDQSAYFYTIATVFAFASTLVLTICPIKKNSDFWTGFGIIGATIAVFLMGPSALLHLPQNIYIMGVGTGLVGIFGQIITIACMISCADSMKERYEGQDEEITQILGSLRVLLFGLSFLVSPYFSSAIQSLFSYSILCDVIGVSLILVFIGLIFAYRANKRERWERQNQSLKEVLLPKQSENQ